MAALRHLAASPAYRHHGRRGGSSSLLLPPLRLLHPGLRALQQQHQRRRARRRLDQTMCCYKYAKHAGQFLSSRSIQQQSFSTSTQTTFEESRLNEADVGDKQKWLKEMDCNLLYWNGKIIDFELPITVRLTVTDTDPGASDSAQGGTKPGAVVTVPSFVNVCDDILVDSRTGQYMNRA